MARNWQLVARNVSCITYRIIKSNEFRKSILIVAHVSMLENSIESERNGTPAAPEVNTFNIDFILSAWGNIICSFSCASYP